VVQPDPQPGIGVHLPGQFRWVSTAGPAGFTV